MLYLKHVCIRHEDNAFNYNIIKQIKEFYDERDKNEVLYRNVNNFTNEINVFDYMVGLQNALHKEYNVFPEYNPDGLGLIFKLYKIVYEQPSLNSESFNDLDTENFTKILIQTNNILYKIINKIFSKNLKENLFGTNVDILNTLKQNNLYILCISILSLIKKNKDEQYIISKLIPPVLYHALIKYINQDNNNQENDEETTILKHADKFQYQAGGSYVDNLCKKIYKNESEYLFCSLNRNLFEKMLTIIIKNNNKQKPENELRKRNKRRNLNLVHKLIYTIIFKSKVPIEMLDSNYSIEHLIPFSSKYEGEIDLDRIGNLFPICIDYNKKRGNRHINNYQEICPVYFNTFISKLCDINTYNNIIDYNNKKAFIKNNNLYDELCNKNEKYIIDFIIDYIF